MRATEQYSNSGTGDLTLSDRVPNSANCWTGDVRHSHWRCSRVLVGRICRVFSCLRSLRCCFCWSGRSAKNGGQEGSVHLRPSPVWARRCRHDVPVCRIRPLVELHGLVWWSHTALQRLAQSVAAPPESKRDSNLPGRAHYRLVILCRREALANCLCAWLGGMASCVMSRARRVWPGEAMCTRFAPAL